MRYLLKILRGCQPNMRVISSILFFFAENIREVNLIIEQGNTSSKVAVYDGGRQIASFTHKQLGVSDVSALFEQYSFTYGILSSVIDTDDELLAFLESKLQRFVFLDEQVPLPITIQYETPRTLGKDRLAAVVGANYLQPGKDLLVIDAGTAITYEIIEASGTFIGGNISPGMTTRFRALNFFTKKLPLVTEQDETCRIGTSTETAIQAGVVNGIVYEMDGYIDEYRLKYPNLLVFLTGGHSFYFERRLKNSIFADINLVLTGLNRILEYNVEN
ncbi:MAG: type III pantothenate kinase [Tannerellaceae bacterium]